MAQLQEHLDEWFHLMAYAEARRACQDGSVYVVQHNKDLPGCLEPNGMIQCI
jgi:hypothetical protein